MRDRIYNFKAIEWEFKNMNYDIGKQSRMYLKGLQTSQKYSFFYFIIKN